MDTKTIPTAIEKAINKIEEGQNAIIGNDEYTKGYDGALTDVITILKKLLPVEKENMVNHLSAMCEEIKEKAKVDFDFAYKTRQSNNLSLESSIEEIKNNYIKNLK